MCTERTIFLIRHGQTEWNLEKRLQGGRDSPLTAKGLVQAEAIATSLRKNPPERLPERLYASPLGRAKRTAEIIAKAFDIPIRTDDRLSELRMGEAEGMTLAEIDRRWPGFLERREDRKWTERWPGGECYLDVHQRLQGLVAETLAPALREIGARPLGIVGHETMNMVLLGHLLGLEPAMVMRLGQPNHVIYRLSGSVIEHAFLGDDDLDWRAGALQKRSDEIVLREAA